MTLEKPCKIWPGTFNSSGYPRGSKQGRLRLIHSWVCEQVHGPRPTKNHDASHLCNVKACIEETHLVWETKSANNLRKSHANKQKSSKAGGAAASAKQRGKGRGWRYRSNTPGKPYLAEARYKRRLYSLGGFATAEEAERAYKEFWERHPDG